MGLDITAYRKLTPATNIEVDEDGYPCDWNNYIAVRENVLLFTEQDFPGRTAGLKPGVYSFTEKFGFRAGSYSGYSGWRNWLAFMAGLKSAEHVWENIEQGPFVELINFSDCEGSIGPIVSAKLAQDFASHEAKVKNWAENVIGGGGDYYQRYLNWKLAFEIAADGGVVEFH